VEPDDLTKPQGAGKGSDVLPLFVALQNLYWGGNALPIKVVTPFLLTHIAQVCSSWTIKHIVNSELRH
jgi:hypothetical protein